MIQFRGREQQRPEMGIRLLEKFAADVAEVGIIESSPRIDGRNMVMVVGPLKNKAEARREQQQQKSGGRNAAKRKIRTDAPAETEGQNVAAAMDDEARAKLEQARQAAEGDA